MQTNEDKPVTINYEDVGSGKPVVLIHGWPLTLEMWEHQTLALVDAGFRVIAYDRRGFGRSSRSSTVYDYDTLADDLHGLIERLDLYDVTLVGFSMGGGEVVRYMSKYGEARVSKIVLISSVVPYLLQTADNPDGVKESVFEEMFSGIHNDRHAFLETFGKQFFGVNLIKKPVSEPLLEHYRMIAASASPIATRECVKAFAYTDFREDLKSIHIPTLLIHGDMDKIVPIEPTSEQTVRMISDAHLIRYEDAPHGLFITERDRLNNDLIAFITEPMLVMR